MPGRGYNPSAGGHWKPEDAVVLVLTAADVVVTVGVVIAELVVDSNVDESVTEVTVEKSIVGQKEIELFVNFCEICRKQTFSAISSSLQYARFFNRIKNTRPGAIL